jgi:hypothetical protein
MTCDHYWRDGILRVERGEPDPHRDTCVVCRREHLSREELIRALPLVAAKAEGDPNWEARVWSRIARLEAAPPSRWRWIHSIGCVAAFVLVLIGWAALRGAPYQTPRIELVPNELAMRSRSTSTSPSVGDRVRITVKTTDEVRIYHGETLVLRCPAGATSGGCVSDGGRMVAEARLITPGTYQLVIIMATGATDHDGHAPVVPPPSGDMGIDLQKIVEAGGDTQITELTVR